MNQNGFLQLIQSLSRSGVNALPNGQKLDPELESQLQKAIRSTQELQQALDSSGAELKESNTQSVIERTSPGQSSAEQSGAAHPSGTATQDKEALLTVLNNRVKDCTLCPDLVANRTQTVFGVGDPNARLCFVGEAPGADEDKKGEPFVGAAGQLLTRIINACEWKREEVYIFNTIKCRPPNNRNPSESECANCRSFFDEQLQILRPEFLCCLGGVAAHNLLDTSLGIGRLRGKIHEYQGIKVVVTYHPAYLLRNPDAKRLVWDDMKFLMKAMGHELKGKK